MNYPAILFVFVKGNSAPAFPSDCSLRGVEIDHAFTERTTFIVTKDGKISATLSSNDDKISPADHVEKSLDAVKQITTKPGAR